MLYLYSNPFLFVVFIYSFFLFFIFREVLIIRELKLRLSSISFLYFFFFFFFFSPRFICFIILLVFRFGRNRIGLENLIKITLLILKDLVLLVRYMRWMRYIFLVFFIIQQDLIFLLCFQFFFFEKDIFLLFEMFEILGLLEKHVCWDFKEFLDLEQFGQLWLN